MENKRAYEEMHIYLLRQLGKNVGVKAPTSLKKDELIQEIISIKEGRKSPCKFQTKGRPTMQIVSGEISDEEEDFYALKKSNDKYRGTISQIDELVQSILNQK